jgi:hypothetical protein
MASVVTLIIEPNCLNLSIGDMNCPAKNRQNHEKNIPKKIISDLFHDMKLEPQVFIFRPKLKLIGLASVKCFADCLYQMNFNVLGVYQVL